MHAYYERGERDETTGRQDRLLQSEGSRDVWYPEAPDKQSGGWARKDCV